MNIQIEIGNTADIVAISEQIPKFRRTTTLERLQARLDEVISFILIAKCERRPLAYLAKQ